jgi:hypothetical protein
MKFEEDSPEWGPRLLRLVGFFYLYRLVDSGGRCTCIQNRPGASFAALQQLFGLVLGTEIERLHEDHHHADAAAKGDLFAGAPVHQHAVNIVDLAMMNIVDDYAPVVGES